MDNSTPNFKTCKNGKNCAHPHGPVLPEYEFYNHNSYKDGLYVICKECQKQAMRCYKSKQKDIGSNSGEQLVINKLRSLGIYAAPGKSSEYKRLDVVAWGCVRIEVKTARRNKKGGFHFGMGRKRDKEYNRSDIVVLVCIDSDVSFHVFRSNHSAFYHHDGRSKISVQYKEDTKFRHSSAGLDNEAMAYHLDRWDLIEEARQRIIDEILSEYDEPDIDDIIQTSGEKLDNDNSNQPRLF